MLISQWVPSKPSEQRQKYPSWSSSVVAWEEAMEWLCSPTTTPNSVSSSREAGKPLFWTHMPSFLHGRDSHSLTWSSQRLLLNLSSRNEEDDAGMEGGRKDGNGANDKIYPEWEMAWKRTTTKTTMVMMRGKLGKRMSEHSKKRFRVTRW